MKSEDVAHWYFRLNGFFTITNFVLHPSHRGPQLTDADIVGVRFPHRAEFLAQPGSDDWEFTRVNDRLYFLIAEVKRNICALNGPWTIRQTETVHKILRDLGPFRERQLFQVAKALYNEGVYVNDYFYCSLFCVGDCVSTQLRSSHPKVPQKTWNEVLLFIYERFRIYRGIKADHEQWDQVGKQLWGICQSERDQNGFVSAVRRSCGLTMSA